MLFALLFACEPVDETDVAPDSDTAADTAAPECAAAVSYVWYTGADCTGAGYAADGVDGGESVVAVSIYSVAGGWCDDIGADVEGAIPVCP